MSKVHLPFKKKIKFASEWLEEQRKLYSGKSDDDIIIKKIKEVLLEYLKSSVKVRILETARKIKHHLSSKESTE